MESSLGVCKLWLKSVKFTKQKHEENQDIHKLSLKGTHE